MIIWIIGLAGSGKTTTANILYSEFKRKRLPTVLIDGDNIRKLFSDDLGYIKEDRLKNAQRIMNLCKLLDENKINVVCAILSISEKHRKWCRENFSSYKEIYIKAELNIIQSRGVRTLYTDFDKGLVKNVVGKDIFFEEPEFPDIIIENNKSKNNFLLAISNIKNLIL